MTKYEYYERKKQLCYDAAMRASPDFSKIWQTHVKNLDKIQKKMSLSAANEEVVFGN